MSFLSRGFENVLLLWCLPVLCIGLLSCKKEGLLSNEKHGRGEVSAFILGHMVRYGGSNTPAARVPAVAITNYVYSEDKDGFQVACPGNKVAALCSVFQSQFGNPALNTTNASGLASFVYAVDQTGVAISCGLDIGIFDGARQEVTQLVVVRAGALR